MKTTALKREAFKIEEKLQLIKWIEDGTNQSVLCMEFSLSKSTVTNIWKNRSAILAAHEKNMNSAKKLRRAERENVEEALFKRGIETFLYPDPSLSQ